MILDTLSFSAGLLHVLTTDAEAIGTVGLIGTGVGIISVGVTVAGFWISIVQIRRVKRSAEASQSAVAVMTKIIMHESKPQSSIQAVSQLQVAKAYLSFDPGAADACIDKSCNSLVGSRRSP